MHILTLTSIATVLSTALTTATPNPDTKPISYPEPDPRFSNITLAHPNARVYTDHAAGHKRDNKPKVYGVYECSDLYFKGKCRWVQIKPSEYPCINAQYWPLGSVGPDKGVTCDIYQNRDCSLVGDKRKGLTFPGVGNCADDKFTSDGGYLVNCPRSWKCRVTG